MPARLTDTSSSRRRPQLATIYALHALTGAMVLAQTLRMSLGMPRLTVTIRTAASPRYPADMRFFALPADLRGNVD